jgi:penicillin-binding protein 1A
MGFVGYDKAADTDFGGKTGTSNNHSDAWFIGTTPKLVVGAWVGGEYRSIHFRTGMLGQGNRTALPICGYFLGSVLNDPAFKKYRCKIIPSHDRDLYEEMYNCGGYFSAPSDSDSISVDSLDIDRIDGYIELDENGDPAVVDDYDQQEPSHAAPTPADNSNTEATKED